MPPPAKRSAARLLCSGSFCSVPLLVTSTVMSGMGDRGGMAAEQARAQCESSQAGRTCFTHAPSETRLLSSAVRMT